MLGLLFIWPNLLKQMIKAEILSSPPISGSIDEVRFGPLGNCTWVRFTDSNREEWCGVFGPGHAARTATVANTAGQSFVVASGQGYLIDVNSRELLHQTQHVWLISAIAVPERDVFLACDYTNLLAYSPAGLLWESRRVSVDGITLSSATPSQVRGQVWNLESWVDFILDVDSWQYRSEFVCKF